VCDPTIGDSNCQAPATGQATTPAGGLLLMPAVPLLLGGARIRRRRGNGKNGKRQLVRKAE